MTPEAVLAELKHGNERYVRGHLGEPNLLARREASAGGHHRAFVDSAPVLEREPEGSVREHGQREGEPDGSESLGTARVQRQRVGMERSHGCLRLE